MDDTEDLVSELLPARGRLFVVSGPSGVGKDAVLSALLSGRTCPPNLERCTTATTRRPRAGEVDGRDYHFLSQGEFESRLAHGYFLEHAIYNGHFYGTPAGCVEARRAAGVDVILKIEVQGALQVDAGMPDAILVFLAPPSWVELERRLRSRGAADEPEVERRLSTARQELAAASRYDYLVFNDTIENAAETLGAIIRAERCRITATPARA